MTLNREMADGAAQAPDGVCDRPFRAGTNRDAVTESVLRCAGTRVNEADDFEMATRARWYGPQGDHSGRWPRHAALPADARDLEAAIAGLRQAADLLFAHHADDGGPARTPDHHYAGRDRPVQAPARRRAAVGHRAVLCHPGSSRRHRGSFPDRTG